LTAAQLIQGLRLSARPHVTSTRIGICSTANPGRCICTASTCGAGMLDADEALVYAGSPSTYVAPNWPLVVIDSAEVDAAVALGPDLPPNTPVPATSSSDSGGGALGWLWLTGLALGVIALTRTSGPSARARRKRLAQ
jgi:serine protease